MKKLSCFYCTEPAVTRNCCRKHYTWQRYHLKRAHDIAYFEGQAIRYDELSSRYTTYLKAHQKGSPKRRLRSVA